MKDQIPCINCITLAICKAQTHKRRIGNTPMNLIVNLTRKCSLIKEYTDETLEDWDGPYLNSERVKDITDFYDLPGNLYTVIEKETYTCKNHQVNLSHRV